jgi:glycerol-3-phosphate dehydrogenase
VWGDEALQHHPGYSVGEIRSLVANEWVVTLSDIVHRRTSLAFSGQLSHSLLCELGEIVASQRGWGSEDIAREIMSITVEEGSSQWALS